MKGNLPLVSIIIINWNGGKIFEACLKSLKKNNYQNWELVIVDNGSTDGSDKYIKCLGSRVKCQVIYNNKNFGFAIANNQGYKKSTGKYILLLNNDTIVEKEFLSILVNRIDKDLTLGVIQPKIYLMDKHDFLDNVGSFLTRTGFLEHWGYMEHDGPKFREEKEIFSAKGACMLCRRSVIEKVGLFDELFISYMEETDFCWRVWIAGYKIIFCPQAKIFHKVGFSSKKQNQIFVNYNSYKNRLACLIKNLQIENLFYIGGCHLVLSILLASFYLFKFQFSKSQMILGAIWWNIIHLEGTLVKRKKIQILRKVGDKELFRAIMHSTNLRTMFSHFSKVEANFQK